MACSLDAPANQSSNHRISFSNDFAEAHQQTSRPISQAKPQPPSSDFEFSVSNDGMMSAEELFFKGQLLPLKEQRPNTLRDELLLGDHDEVFSFGPQKCPNRWKEIFGLKKPQIGHKKVVKADLVLQHKAQAINILHAN